MALFKPYKITSNKLSSLPIKEGQFIIVTDTEEIYVDKSASERIKLGGGGSGITNLVDGEGEGSIKSINATSASGSYAVAEGINTTASGDYSHAEGAECEASGDYSHAEGYMTIANNPFMHAEGSCNDTNNDLGFIHVIGNGGPLNRSNAHTVDINGNAWYSGSLRLGGTHFLDPNAREVAAYISGTTEPTSDIGEDGDIYILIEE